MKEMIDHIKITERYVNGSISVEAFCKKMKIYLQQEEERLDEAYVELRELKKGRIQQFIH